MFAQVLYLNGAESAKPSMQGDFRKTYSLDLESFDEFLQRGIIVPDKTEDFKDAYKDPDEFCCLFVIDLQFTNFVFIPYPEDWSGNKLMQVTMATTNH